MMIPLVVSAVQVKFSDIRGSPLSVSAVVCPASLDGAVVGTSGCDGVTLLPSSDIKTGSITGDICVISTVSFTLATLFLLDTSCVSIVSSTSSCVPLSASVVTTEQTFPPLDGAVVELLFPTLSSNILVQTNSRALSDMVISSTLLFLYLLSICCLPGTKIPACSSFLTKKVWPARL